MAKLPTQNRILKEDLKGSPSWFDAVITILNTFMQNVYSALNKGLTFADNLNAFTQELIYVTPSTYPAGVAMMSFQTQLKTKALGVVVWQAYEQSSYTPAPGPCYPPWVENNGVIQVGTITGLEASKTYLIRLTIT